MRAYQGEPRRETGVEGQLDDSSLNCLLWSLALVLLAAWPAGAAAAAAAAAVGSWPPRQPSLRLLGAPMWLRHTLNVCPPHSMLEIPCSPTMHWPTSWTNHCGDPAVSVSTRSASVVCSVALLEIMSHHSSAWL